MPGPGSPACWKAERISGAAWASSDGRRAVGQELLGTGPPPRRRWRPAAAAACRGTGGRRSRRGRAGRPGGAWPGRRRRARRCPPAGRSRTRAIPAGPGPPRCRDAGGGPTGRAGRPRPPVPGSRRSAAWARLSAICWAWVWAKVPVADWPGWRSEAKVATARMSAEARHEATDDQEPGAPAQSPPGTRPVGGRRSRHRAAETPAAETPASGTPLVDGHRGVRHGRLARRASAPHVWASEGRQPGQVPLAQGQVVLVGEVAGQVLGVGVGQRPGEEPPALLERPRAPGSALVRPIPGRHRPRRAVVGGGRARPPARPRRHTPPTRGSSQTSSDHPLAGGSRTIEEPYRATRYDSICWSVRPSAICWGTAARTATAVGAVDWATERSSQLGQRTTDSMAAARWASVGGDEVKDAAAEDQGHHQHDAERRPQREAGACSRAVPAGLGPGDELVEPLRRRAAGHRGHHPPVGGDEEGGRVLPHPVGQGQGAVGSARVGQVAPSVCW